MTTLIEAYPKVVQAFSPTGPAGGLGGPVGMIGPQNIAGPVGPIGVTGPIGYGFTGSQGAAGSVGPHGFTGRASPPGATGMTGYMGPSGHRIHNFNWGAYGPIYKFGSPECNAGLASYYFFGFNMRPQKSGIIYVRIGGHIYDLNAGGRITVTGRYGISFSGGGPPQYNIDQASMGTIFGMPQHLVQRPILGVGNPAFMTFLVQDVLYRPDLLNLPGQELIWFDLSVYMPDNGGTSGIGGGTVDLAYIQALEW
jgi:hypothetical protein